MSFDLGRTFDLVFIAANSLLHLHEAEDLVDCFRLVRRHLAPGARLVFDVFNPSVRMLAQADGVRRRRDALSSVDPDRGVVHVDVAETYDAAAQVTRGRGEFWTDSEADFVVALLEIRSIFPQELPPRLSLGGLRVVERFGDWSRGATHRRCGAPALRLRTGLNREPPGLSVQVILQARSPAASSSFTICGISGCSGGGFGRATEPDLTLTLLIVTGVVCAQPRTHRRNLEE